MSEPKHDPPAAPPELPSLQGVEAPLNSPEQRRAAMLAAVDYRGDVTVHARDGRVLEGYVFDCRTDGPEPCIRLIPRDGGARLQLPVDQITRLIFSGKDAAAGKSWETWLKRCQEKKARGEKASLESEPLE